MLTKEIFCYADVLYRIVPYEKILEDPNGTIIYDRELAARIDEVCMKRAPLGQSDTGGRMLLLSSYTAYVSRCDR